MMLPDTPPIPAVRRVYLTGLMGSGKSTVAPLLAEHLGWDWLDLDRVIEGRAGTTIPELFAHGEPHFRAAESAALAAIAARPLEDRGLVIATGGGIIRDPANRAMMRASGRVVALEVSPMIAAARVAGTSRPLLGDEPLRRLQALHLERASLYADADFPVRTDAEEPPAIAWHIFCGLIARGFLGDGRAARHITVAIPGAPHTITIGWGALAQLATIIDALHLAKRATIITDAHVAALFLTGVSAVLGDAGYDIGLISIPAGEDHKTLATVEHVYNGLIARRAERGEAIIALGGGVVGDLAGFVAATYLRGVPLIQVPTTLLAQVDSAIGGKTGVNHPRAKNAIGAFYQPHAIVIDPALLQTLDDRLLREGLGEVVKYGVILDADLFGNLERHAPDLLRRDPVWLAAIIERCAAIKARVVAADEREDGQRLLLNYGHTIGHALETLAGYGTLLHGEAVFLGMAVEARIARSMGLIDPELVARQQALAHACGGDLVFPRALTAEGILEAMRLDKKTRGGRVRWALPDALGHGGTYAVPDAIVLAALQASLVSSSSDIAKPS